MWSGIAMRTESWHGVGLKMQWVLPGMGLLWLCSVTRGQEMACNSFIVKCGVFGPAKEVYLLH